MEEMTTGLCPKCGHTLQIPAELERFSCMYCGEAAALYAAGGSVLFGGGLRGEL